MKNNLKFSLIIIALGLVIASGCKKNAASIVGTWTETTQREQEKIGANFVFDTTVNVSLPAPVITFNSNGSYRFSVGSAGSGTYTLSGNTLTVTDSGSTTPQTLTVVTLTDNALTLQQSSTDTAAPYPTYYNSINFKR